MYEPPSRGTGPQIGFSFRTADEALVCDKCGHAYRRPARGWSPKVAASRAERHKCKPPPLPRCTCGEKPVEVHRYAGGKLKAVHRFTSSGGVRIPQGCMIDGATALGAALLRWDKWVEHQPPPC